MNQENTPRDMLTDQSDGGSSSVEISSSQYAKLAIKMSHHLRSFKPYHECSSLVGKPDPQISIIYRNIVLI